MGLIQNSKWGSCARCLAEDTACKKRGKELLCLHCCKVEDNKKQMAKASERNKVRSLQPAYNNSTIGKIKGSMDLNRWFIERREEMTGRCKHCLGKTEKRNDLTYKCSIAHILPKAYFKSVATHPDNWVELCFYQNSCHTNFDNYTLDMMELNCFDEVLEKFLRMYPSIAEEEKRRIPALLLNYVKDNT